MHLEQLLSERLIKIFLPIHATFHLQNTANMAARTLTGIVMISNILQRFGPADTANCPLHEGQEAAFICKQSIIRFLQWSIASVTQICSGQPTDQYPEWPWMTQTENRPRLLNSKATNLAKKKQTHKNLSFVVAFQMNTCWWTLSTFSNY